MTSVNRSVRVPSACISRSLRYRRLCQRHLRRVQASTERSCRPSICPCTTIHIEVAVAVEVEQRDAWRHDFGKIELARHAVEMDEVEARFTGGVGEPLLHPGLSPPRKVRAGSAPARAGLS